MSVADARRALGLILQTAHPRWSVFPPTWAPEDIRKTTLLLIRTQVSKLPAAPLGFAQNEFALWLLEPQGSGEDRLDDDLDALLETLDEGSQTRWTAADRDVYAESLSGYRITLTTASQRS